MWRLIGVFIIGGILGAGAGIGVGFFIFPFVFPPPAANDTLNTEELTAVIAKGQFIHANTMDPVHYGTGGVTVLQRTVFLESDFEVGPGPKFHVYLVPKEAVRRAGDVKGSGFHRLGAPTSLQRQPEIYYPGDDKYQRVQVGGYLVRRLWRADLTGRPAVPITNYSTVWTAITGKFSFYLHPLVLECSICGDDLASLQVGEERPP